MKKRADRDPVKGERVMVAKKGKKPTRKIKSLPVKAMSARKAKSVKGGSLNAVKITGRMPTAVE